MEAWYRNPREDVQKFLELKHKDQYKVYNLCIEEKWSYEPETFHHRVARFPFADHQAPPLHLMRDFCQDVEKWMADGGDHMAAIHCKAGKGRAGMMICCWLIHSKEAATAEEAMLMYGRIRTKDGKGVTIPSQRRYVGYYEDIFYYGLPTPPKIKWKTLKICSSLYAKPSVADIYVIILQGNTEELLTTQPKKAEEGQDCIIDIGLEIAGDIKVIVHDKNLDKAKDIAHFYFNTAFVDANTLILKKPEIDRAWKDKKCKRFKPDFHFELGFEGADVGTMAQMKKGKTENKENKEKKEKKEKKTKKEKKSRSDPASPKSPSSKSHKSSKSEKSDKSPKEDKTKSPKEEKSPKSVKADKASDDKSIEKSKSTESKSSGKTDKTDKSDGDDKSMDKSKSTESKSSGKSEKSSKKDKSHKKQEAEKTEDKGVVVFMVEEDKPKQEAKAEEPKEEAKVEEPKPKEEAKAEEPKPKDEPKPEPQSNTEEAKPKEEPKPQPVEHKVEEVKPEEPKAEETKPKEEPKTTQADESSSDSDDSLSESDSTSTSTSTE
eukprot:TRINITY_DN674_c0_g1_i3.p1 TRINITY_DN674_c0_g1~~TRINITY_DN674_c0_g1_i3.p1  ORF type:complete len:618 (-),score=190.30 TRINITY_DN674_c0_g1_i3:88-1728(-)